MAVYLYKARDKFSKLIKGIMTADSEMSIAVKLKQMGFVPVTIILKKPETKIDLIFGGLKKLSFSELNMFTRQFYVLQKAGLPLLVSLNVLKEQAANSFFKEIIAQISRDIEAGASLSVALEKHPDVFNALYVNMIKTAEASGKLEEVFERLAILGEREEIINLRIKGASRYPMIVVVSMIIGFLILTTMVIPRFVKIYSQYSVALPLPTLILVGINYVIRNFWWLVILIICLCIYLTRKFINTKGGRFWWDGFKLKIPVLGPLTLKLIMSRFSRITGTLLRSGVPVLKILELVSVSVGNAVVSRTIDNIKISINEGRGMLESMKSSGLFPLAVIQMVSVGEGTGKLDELLLHISDYYDSQIDYTVNNLVVLIEPILIFVLGCGVLFMALGIFLPIWNLMSIFKK